MELALKISALLGDVGQFAFGFVAIILSVIALLTKRQDIFKSELAKSQFHEIGVIRNKLSQIFFDVTYVSQFKGQIEMMGWSLEDFRNECPEQWDQFSRYKDNSLELFYKLMTPNYYLFPKWVSREKITSHFVLMKEFAPFTISATGNKNHDEIEDYQLAIMRFIEHLDNELRNHA